MKKTALLAAFLLTVFSATAFVGYSGPEDEAHALGATGSSSASQSVSQNGTDWQMKFTEVSAGSSNQSTGVNEYSFQDSSANLSGTVQIAQPCYTLNAEVEESGDNLYTLNITSERETNEEENPVPCADVISYRKYNATFETDDSFRLEVVHDGDTVKAIEHPGYKTDTSEDRKGLITGFIHWIKGLFSNEPERTSYELENGGEVEFEEGDTGKIEVEKN